MNGKKAILEAIRRAAALVHENRIEAPLADFPCVMEHLQAAADAIRSIDKIPIQDMPPVRYVEYADAYQPEEPPGPVPVKLRGFTSEPVPVKFRGFA
jgi:hypothetical protein